MLKALTIQDLAVVRRLDVELERGLTVLTGETGAGKSILVGALGLALGDRADTSMVSSGAGRASVSASFDITTNAVLRELLDEHGLEDGDECILRRTLSSDGRSRAFCNATPIPVQLLRRIGELLVDIHGQHAHQSLLRKDTQRAIIDEYGELGGWVADTRAAHARWKSADEELRRLTGSGSLTASRRELLQYQLAELEALALGDGELASLESDHRRLANASRLIEGCGSISGQLFEGDGGAAKMESARALLVELSQLDPGLEPAAGLIEQAAVHLAEAEREIRRFGEAVEIDPARLRQVEERLEALHDLSRKHGCGMDELAGLADRLAEELETLERNETRVTELEHEIARSLEDYAMAAGGLHDRRTATAATMSTEIGERMRALGMPHAVFEAAVAVDEGSTPSRNGYDRIEFLVSTNPDQAQRALAKVASGGELSRISLAIQVATAGVSGVPVLVYDEVDAGVGGRVADILSRSLHALAARRQVLCITHLPQIASAGDHHFVVGKAVSDGVTQTEVRLLDKDERVEELAKMLGGRRVSEKALAHARELLDSSAA